MYGILGNRKLLLELPGDFILHDRCRYTGIENPNDDFRVNDMGEEINLEAIQRKQAQNDHGQCDHNHGYGVMN